MGRPRATKADGRLPPYVYRKPRLNLVEYRPYLGGGKFGKSVYLKGADGAFLPFTASRDAIFKAYALVVGEEKPARTLSWLLSEYVASPRYARLMPATRKHYDHYRTAIEGKDLSNGRRFGDVPLEKITRGVIAKYRDSMAKTPIQANRHLQFLGAAFSFALEREYVSENPVTGVEKNRQPPRSRYVTQTEYRVAYLAAPDWLKAAMELAYLCRARRGEVLGMKMREHILEDGVYVQRTKGSDSEVTLWSDRLRAAVALARTHNRDVLSPYLLHGADGKPISSPAFNSAWKRLMEKVKAAGVVPFPYHDLKAAGISDHKKHASGHRSERMAEVYIRVPDRVEPTR
jgi:integrase